MACWASSGAITGRSWSARLPALTAEQQGVAYVLAVKLVFCDRVVKPEEEDFLSRLASELSLPPGRTAQIQEVFALLQRDVLACESVE